MSTLKIFLHIETTLETTIQKNLRNLELKISVAEFCYSQTILLLFTVILFHSNLDEKVTSSEQKVTSNEQEIMSKWAKSNENEEKVRGESHIDFRTQFVIMTQTRCPLPHAI